MSRTSKKVPLRTTPIPEVVHQTVECLWNTKQAEQYLGYTRSSIERLVAQGIIPHIKLPGTGARFNIRFRKSDLDLWIQKRGRICKGRATTLPSATTNHEASL